MAIRNIRDAMLGGAAIGALVGLFGGGIIVGISTGDWNNSGPVWAWVIICVLIGGVIGVVMGFAASRREERKKQQEQAAEAAAEARKQQEACESYLRNLLSDSRRDLLRLREMVPAAEDHLHRAEQEFAEGAFAPFWDEIEHATNKLAAYQRGVETINRNSIAYHKTAAALPTRVSPFNLPEGQLPDGRTTAIRLKTIVRAAQKNYQFASIYEQRKTNQILVAGFGTLASAIYTIGDSITLSLDELSTNLHKPLDELLEETREHSRQAQLAADRHRKILVEQSKQAAAEGIKRRQFEHDVAEKLEEQTRMLNNIQRGRKPFP